MNLVEDNMSLMDFVKSFLMDIGFYPEDAPSIIIDYMDALISWIMIIFVIIFNMYVIKKVLKILFGGLNFREFQNQDVNVKENVKTTSKKIDDYVVVDNNQLIETEVDVVDQISDKTEFDLSAFGALKTKIIVFK